MGIYDELVKCFTKDEDVNFKGYLNSDLRKLDVSVHGPYNKPTGWNGKYDIEISWNKGARVYKLNGASKEKIISLLKSPELQDVRRYDISYSR